MVNGIALPAYFVIYDPFSGQKTSGGGWFTSGFLIRKIFGFSAKYKTGESVPSGQLLLIDFGQGLSIASQSYDWLVFTSTTAILDGTCYLNSSSGYHFRLEVEDLGEPGKNIDRFNLVVTDLQGAVVYGVDGVINGGNIQVH